MRRRGRYVLGFAVTAAVAIYLLHPQLLRLAGAALVRSEPPQRADAIVVLAGDHRGYRVLQACELVKSGNAPVVLISGPAEWYGINEAELAIQYAARHGCPRNLLSPVFMKAMSTTEEVEALRPVLASRGVRKVLVVTSNYHTARAYRALRRILGDSLEIRMAAAPDPYYSPDAWWHTREGQKTFFFEFSKTVAEWVGL